MEELQEFLQHLELLSVWIERMLCKAVCDTWVSANTLEDGIQIQLQAGDMEEKSYENIQDEQMLFIIISQE